MYSRLVKATMVGALCFGLSVGTALAECAVNTRGQVYCAKTPVGGADRDRAGEVVCGKGECKRNRFGAIYCSSREGGGAEMDWSGELRCLGGCEQATREACEQGQ